MIHIIVGHEAAKNLSAAFEIDENLQGEILILKDTLGVGPIAIQEAANMDAVRTEFWRIASNHPHSHKVEDRQMILQTIDKAITEEEPLCFWMAPCVTDVCAYYYLLTLCKAYPELLHTINIIGLPFLNEKGQLFYPKNFSEIIPKEFIKTKRLLKKVTPAEYEVEGDEWSKLQQDNTWIRIYEGGKNISSKANHYFDNLLLGSLSTDFQKGSKVINEALKKSTQTVSDIFFQFRLRELIKAGNIAVQGDVEKAMKDFEVKKVGSEIVQEEVADIQSE